MKKLKIILPIFLISLFFIPKTYALVSADFSINNNSYFSRVVSYINSHTGSTSQDFYDMVLSNVDYDDEDLNYVCFYSGDKVYCYKSSQEFSLRAIRTNNNNFLSLNLFYVPDSTYNYTRYSLTFNSNNEITGVSTDFSNNYSVINDGQSYLIYLQNTGSIGYIPIASSYDIINLNTVSSMQINQVSFNGGSSFSLPQDISLSDISVNTNYYSNVTNYYGTPPFTCDLEYLGSTTNVSSYTFRVTGTTNVLSEPLEGNIVLTALGLDENSFSGNVNNLVVNVNEGPSIDEDLFDVQYDLNFEFPNIILHYIITPEDDIDAYADITFTLLYNYLAWEDFFDNKVEIRACQPYHGILTYGYRDRVTGITNSTDSTLMNWLNNESNNAGSKIQRFMDSIVNGENVGPIDNIINVPVSILRALVDKLDNNTCQPLNLPIPFAGGTLILPCVNTLYNKINGLSTFINWFSSIFSAFLIYKYLIFLYKWVDDTLTLRENTHFGGY